MSLRAPLLALAATVFFGLAACSTEAGPTDSPTLVGVDDSPDQDPVTSNAAEGPDGNPVDVDAGGSVSAGEVSYPIGTTLETTADLNLRTGASTASSILRVMPEGSQVVTVNLTTSKGGFLNVKHSGLEGFASAKYLKVVSGGGGGATPQDKAIARAKTGVGFTYWWGHGKWQAGGVTSSNKGTCSGSCPSCTHGGASNGADCSGFVAKVWQVPSSNTDVSVDSHPYSTASFNASSSLWSTVSRSSLKKADALVYNSGGAGHIVVFESGDGWGSMWTYEARGCSYGIVHNLRTAGSAYKGIRRAGF
ncbi:hypothetical protein BH09MYX1_BH09MYX1_18300 [soil metagenome]